MTSEIEEVPTEAPVKVEIPEIVPPQEILGGGAIAGICAGAIMILIAMILSKIGQVGFGYPLRLIAAMFLGKRALAGGGMTLLLGAAVHFTISASLGVIFALFTRRRMRASTATLAGLAFSLLVWACMTYVALPIFDPLMRLRVSRHPGLWLFDHLLFGVALGLTPWIRRSLFLPGKPATCEILRKGEARPAA